jgi:hypothetical protein
MSVHCSPPTLTPAPAYRTRTLSQALNEVVTTVAARRAKGSPAAGEVLDARQLQQVLELLAACSTAEEECRNVFAGETYGNSSAHAFLTM